MKTEWGGIAAGCGTVLCFVAMLVAGAARCDHRRPDGL